MNVVVEPCVHGMPQCPHCVGVSRKSCDDVAVSRQCENKDVSRILTVNSVNVGLCLHVEYLMRWYFDNRAQSYCHLAAIVVLRKNNIVSQLQSSIFGQNVRTLQRGVSAMAEHLVKCHYCCCVFIVLPN